MRHLATIIAALALATIAAPASAAYVAFLQNCSMQTSVSGAIYVGTYNLNGRMFQRMFPASVGYCPAQIEVF